MRNLLDVQVELYPELLRRLAAGEKLSAAGDEGEKLAAVALVVEALENEIAAEASGESGSQEKTALLGALEGLAAGALLAGPVSKGLKALRGEPQIPEHAQELLKSFRSIIDARRAEDLAKRRLGMAAVGGAAAGAIAMKALDKKEEAKAAAEESKDEDKDGDEKKKLEELRAKAKEERGADKEVPAFMQKDEDKKDDKDKDEKKEKSDEKKDESKSEKKDDKKEEKREEKEEEREEAEEAKEGAVKAAAAPGTSALLRSILKNLQ